MSAPVTIVGDIHGQFLDLLKLFEKAGCAPDTNYVFMGDFVDRGYHSVETFQLLMVLKIKYPGNITLLRGNHETRVINQLYGFYEENLTKYGNANAWKYVNEVFDHLPIAAIVEGKVFCLHGGLSPELRTVDQIRTPDRRSEPETGSPLNDLLWSDPSDKLDDWRESPRGAGYLFGARVTAQFNHINGFDLIARAH